MGSCFSCFERTHPHDQEETADDAEVDHEAEAIFRLALAVINECFNNAAENSVSVIPRSTNSSKRFGSVHSNSSDGDACPTCFEGYTEQNPMIITKCGHHFHLSCILEWQERRETCPICRKVRNIQTYIVTVVEFYEAA
ncbi:E3 ubiquitin-protein ligase [Glycine soja]|uniref:RING-type E3 ubiquitin transferase n=1 Tax=Glycine soja TaxID=3848 RepID=A0A445LMU6_GLYSO|nr:E3 ubiquitin-protein ligase [Glycine soja]